MGRRPSRPWTLRCELLNAWRYPRSARSFEPCERRYCLMKQQNVRLASSESAWNLCLMVAHLFDVREPFTGVPDHMSMTVGFIRGQPIMGPVFFLTHSHIHAGATSFRAFGAGPTQDRVKCLIMDSAGLLPQELAMQDTDLEPVVPRENEEQARRGRGEAARLRDATPGLKRLAMDHLNGKTVSQRRRSFKISHLV